MCTSVASRELGGESLDVLDHAPNAVVAEGDLTVQPAGVRQIDALLIVGVGLELADVVQQRTAHRNVAIDAPEGGANRAHRLRHAETVLEQTVGVGLVVVLGRRRRPVAGPQLALLAEHDLEQRPQMRLLDRVQQLADLRFHLLDAARRAVAQILELEAARRGRLEATEVDLRPETWVDRVATADAYRRSRPRQLLHVNELLPDHARDRPGAVAKLQAQVLAAVAPLAALSLANQQNLVDLHAVTQLVQEHALKVDVGADETAGALARGRHPRDPALVAIRQSIRGDL